MKNLKKLGIIFATFLLVFSLVACGSNENTSTSENVETSSEETSMAQPEDGKVIDREGNEVTLPEEVDKIISLAPSITETLVDLGLSDRLIAVDKYSKKVEGVNQDLPIFDIMNPDAENITLLEPDIIFGTGMSKTDGTDPFAPMIEMGAFVTVIPTSKDIQGIIDDILYIGKVTKTEDKAREIVDNYTNEVMNINQKLSEANVDDNEKITVYFEAAGQNYTFGSDTFLNDMLKLLNAENVFGSETGWNEVSSEQIIEKNPAVILTNADYIDDPIAEIKARDGWNVIDAVKNDRVYLIDMTSKRANERSISAFKQMAKALYPDLFTE